jgi:hypothetical protein
VRPTACANSISPDLTITDQIRPFLKDPDHPMNAMQRSHPLGRLGEREDVARVALFLASADAAYLNAVDVVVDGGQSIIVIAPRLRVAVGFGAGGGHVASYGLAGEGEVAPAPRRVPQPAFRDKSGFLPRVWHRNASGHAIGDKLEPGNLVCHELQVPAEARRPGRRTRPTSARSTER